MNNRLFWEEFNIFSIVKCTRCWTSETTIMLQHNSIFYIFLFMLFVLLIYPESMNHVPSTVLGTEDTAVNKIECQVEKSITKLVNPVYCQTLVRTRENRTSNGPKEACFPSSALPHCFVSASHLSRWLQALGTRSPWTFRAGTAPSTQRLLRRRLSNERIHFLVPHSTNPS